MNDSILDSITWQEAVNICAGAIDGVGDCGYLAGRDEETNAILRRIENASREGGRGSTVFIRGDNGVGKTTFVKHIQKKVMDEVGDIACYIPIEGGCKERFHGAGTRTLYQKFVNGLSLRTEPKGGALEKLLQGFIRKVQDEMGAASDGKGVGNVGSLVEACMKRVLVSTEGGDINIAFAKVVSLYISGVTGNDDALRLHALKWLKGEYETKRQVGQDLGGEVDIFINDGNAIAMVMNWIRLFAFLGKTTVVAFDEIQRLVKLDDISAGNNWAVIKDLYDFSLELRTVLIFLGTNAMIDTYHRKGLFSNKDLSDRLGGPNRISGGVSSFDEPLFELKPVSKPEALLDYLTLIKCAKEMVMGCKLDVTKQGIQAFLRKEKRECETYDPKRKQDPTTISVNTRHLIQDFMRALSALAANPGMGFAAAGGLSDADMQENDDVETSLEVL